MSGGHGDDVARRGRPDRDTTFLAKARYNSLSREGCWMTILPAHYSIDGVCAACRGAIKSGDDRYRIGDREYHAHCFDISLWFPVVRVETME